MQLADHGYQVVAAARSTDKLSELAKETGVHPMTLDVTDGIAVDDVVATGKSQTAQLEDSAAR
jgi:NADP-dependent 3-hydroxy acid dehydrogenase YdfG